MNNTVFDFQEIRNACKDGTFKMLGKGSSRICYDIGNDLVAKIAFTESGLLQNEEEYNLTETDSLFNVIIDRSDDFQIIITRKALKTTFTIAMKMLKVKKNEAYGFMVEFARTYSLCVGDLIRHSSWGLVDSKPVLIDYGCTLLVFETYYKQRMVYSAGRYQVLKPRNSRIKI